MVTIQGTIGAVMETWPLQLTVVAGAERHSVTLSEATVIRRAGRPADPSALAPGLRVTVRGPAQPGGVLAEEIVVD